MFEILRASPKFNPWSRSFCNMSRILLTKHLIHIVVTNPIASSSKPCLFLHPSERRATQPVAAQVLHARGERQGRRLDRRRRRVPPQEAAKGRPVLGHQQRHSLTHPHPAGRDRSNLESTTNDSTHLHPQAPSLIDQNLSSMLAAAAAAATGQSGSPGGGPAASFFNHAALMEHAAAAAAAAAAAQAQQQQRPRRPSISAAFPDLKSGLESPPPSLDNR